MQISNLIDTSIRDGKEYYFLSCYQSHLKGRLLLSILKDSHICYVHYRSGTHIDILLRRKMLKQSIQFKLQKNLPLFSWQRVECAQMSDIFNQHKEIYHKFKARTCQLYIYMDMVVILMVKNSKGILKNKLFARPTTGTVYTDKLLFNLAKLDMFESNPATRLSKVEHINRLHTDIGHALMTYREIIPLSF